MLDHPRGADILAAISKLLRETLMPQLPANAAFQARVAANAIDLVAREINYGHAVESEALGRLRALLSRDGSLQELETDLSGRIRRGELDLQSAGLAEHLWLTTLDKMKIDQPAYASYRRTIEVRAGPATTPERGLSSHGFQHPQGSR
ncbi:DUF6285 domain-containing protein [Bradyrhizobium sp. 1(2017)]|jgi:hypothetical protein|uniref:DUF6285 domain-containing protein n=1 Tax=Bradyrhizobium sp. 1(2017) TaxID=1404888 RepID=UPI00140EAE1A|nr:DUF6285 domain-containing protein [Bradyrhizobium sp. 1(2017)]QIO31787.1 hypothetical protein HAP40_08040 [Bradyrhizobium sp. 1(2017)]